MELEEISLAFIDNEIANAKPWYLHYHFTKRFRNEAAVMSREMISIRDSKDWSSDSVTIARESRIKYVIFDIKRTIQ